MSASWRVTTLVGMLGVSLSVPVQADPTTGIVSTTRRSCDYFIVDAPGGYAVLEWFGGATAHRGDKVTGVMETYGFHSIYDVSQDRSIRVYVDDYGLDEDEASDKLNDDCD